MTEVQTPAGLWLIPEGYRPDNLSSCRSCGEQILWAITPRGKRAPLNRGGVSHFATCPDAMKWRK